MPINRKKTKIEMREDGPFQQEGFDLMAAVFAVHNEVGGGLAEEVYQESLEIELSLRGMPFIAKQELAISYKGRELKRRYIPDLYVHEGMVVELKAVSHLLPEHEAQFSITCGWPASESAISSTSLRSSAPNGGAMSFNTSHGNYHELRISQRDRQPSDLIISVILVSD